MNDCTYERLKDVLEEGANGDAPGGRLTQSGGGGAVDRAAGADNGRRSGSLRGCGSRPGPWHQLGQPRARPALGQPVDDVGEIGLRVEPAKLGRLDDGVNRRRAPAAFVAAQKQEVFPRDRNRAAIVPMSGKMSSCTIAGIHCSGTERGASRVSGANRASSCMSS